MPGASDPSPSPLKKQIIINANKDRSRIAIVEDGELVELYVENPDNVRTIGNIYLGNVEKVMPTLRAAFVDIGEKQDAFLHFSDLTDNFPKLLAMAGEDVPGLDEPMLALAPQKRIADDESEPDIEDVLEVEPADEKDESRSRSTRSRRSRGRGRSGRAGESEEEEQEEAGEEKKPARGVFVLDLTTKKAPRPAAVRTPAATAEAAEAPVADAGASEAQTPEETADTAPRTRAPRKPRAAKATPAEAPDDSAASDSVAPDTGTPADDAEAPAPKKRRSRAKKADSPEPSPAPEPTEAPADDARTATADAPAPRTRAPRAPRRADPERAPVADAAVPADPATAPPTTDPAEDETTARPRRRPRGRAAVPTTDAPTPTAPAENTATDRATLDTAPANAAGGASQTDASEADERPRSRRRGRPAAEAPVADLDLQPETADEDGRPRSRRQTRASRADEASAPDDLQAPLAEQATEPEPTDAPAPRRPRGTMTIDLSSTAKKTAPARSTSARPEPLRTEPLDEEPTRPKARAEARAEAGDSALGAPRPDVDREDDGDDERPRSRRRTRGRSGNVPDDRDERAEVASTPEARTDDASDDAEGDADERPRSRRGRRTRADGTPDATPEPARRAPRDDDEDTDAPSAAPGNGRPAGRGRDADAPRRPDAARGGRDVGKRRTPIPSNEQLLRRGGNVICKVTKEPISAKGSRVSTDISLAGRFLVLVPAADYVAVSKKIESAKERRRLRTLAQSLKPANCGVIVRTVAEGRDAKSLDTDLRLLVDKWRSIEAKLDGGKAKAPILLYEDVNMVSSIIRDLFSEDFDRILVDDPKVFKNVQAYVRAVAPDMADKVELHRGTTPVYRSVGIEKQVEEAFSRRVNMKGGGYLFIETTEAMHVIDVNSGRAGRGKSQKDNLIAVNLEAAREVAKQLRLRDLGGIIVVDFIDLRLESDRRKITNALLEGFAKDRAVTKLLPMSDFGLVQITRQRLRPSITAQPEGEDGETDPAERAARAGAGEIEQATDRRDGRDDDRASGRGLDAGPADDTDDRPTGRTGRARDDRGRDTRDDRSDRGRSDRSRTGRRDEAARPDDAEPARLDGDRDDTPAATTPEAVTARLRAWLDVYRKTVDERYRDRPVVITVHPLFLAHLQRGFISTLTRWRLGIRSVPWRIEADADIDPLTFDVRDEKSTRSLLKRYTP